VTGPDITVGSIWTPQGFECFGGWSLTVVWKFPHATTAAPAKRRVSVHGGHVRLHTKTPTLHTPIARHPAGGGVRPGITAYAGDRATDGDQLLIGDTSVAGRNAFVSSAHGAANPNNMSVDARTLTITEDAYLVQNIAWSFPLPELTLAVDPERPATHPKDTVTHTATVTNAGDAQRRACRCAPENRRNSPTRESHPRLHDTSGGRRLPDHGHRKRHQRSR
jgi:hypothetical protein